VDESATEGELTFRFDVGMWPEVAVNIPQGTFTKFQVELDEADIEQQVLRAREYHFRDAYPEESADGDVLIGTAVAAAEGSKKHFITVRTAELADAELRAKFIGLKKADTVEVNLEDLFGSNPAELAKALHTSEEELGADFDPNVTFSPNRIMRHGMSDLDQEFFDKVIGPGQAYTEEEFLERFKGLIQAQADKAADDRLMNDILTQTLIENEVPLPEDWVVRTIIEGNKGEEKPSNEEVRAYFHERHAAEMKQSYVTQSLLEQHDMTIGHEDIEERVGEDIRNAYVQYGVEDPDAAMVAKAVTNFLEKDNNYDNVVNTLQRERLASILLQHVNVETQVVSLAEFQSSQANDNEGADVID
jgi:trigger factor